MANTEKQSPLLVCTSCGKPAEPGQHMCDHCSAPLTPYAHSDPVMGIMARGFAAHKATTDPQKSIVVIGMWLWMLPMLFFGLMMLRAAVGIFIEEGFERWRTALIGVVFVLVGLVMVWTSGGILLKTTFRYLETSERKSEESDAREENIECLQCRHTFPADDDACPKCGWSYANTYEE
jgi:uncharacterized paraquat-inducible protein A